MKLKLLTLHFDLFDLRKNKIAFLERRVSTFVALTKVLAHIISKITENTLFTKTHC